MTHLAGALRADLRNITRDPLLVLAAVIPLLLALLLRYGFPAATRAAAPHLQLAPHADLAVAWMLVQAPLLYGFAVGFLLLDERDENVLAAIAVTPVGKLGWLRYRVLLPCAWALVAGVAMVFAAGLVTVPPLRLLAAVGLSALEAPLVALLLASIAADKVQGLALAKASGIVVIAPFAVLLEPPLRWAAGAVPHFWVAELLVGRALSAGEFWARALLAYAVHAGALWLLLRIYLRRSG